MLKAMVEAMIAQRREAAPRQRQAIRKQPNLTTALTGRVREHHYAQTYEVHLIF